MSLEDARTLREDARRMDGLAREYQEKALDEPGLYSDTARYYTQRAQDLREGAEQAEHDADFYEEQ